MFAPQKPKENTTTFVLGIICLVISLAFLLFAFYIIPFLLLNYTYDVPSALSTVLAIFHDSYEYSIFTSKLILWLVFVIPGLITGYLAYYISHLLDEEKEE